MVLCSAILILFSAAYSSTLYVGPGQTYTTIQSAVDAASNGDIIIVMDGTYSGNVSVNKQLTIQSQNGVDYTTVQTLQSSHSGFNVTANYVTITGFNIANEADDYANYGIKLNSCEHCNISHNTIAANSFRTGIYVSSGRSNTITNNICNSNHYHGISVWSSSDNTISDNTCNSNNNYGIRLARSGNNILTNNTMSGNTYNFGVSGASLPEYNQNIDTSNLVDGKPIYYWVNQQDNQIPAGAGFVGLVDCEKIAVRDLTLTKNGEGVLLAFTENSSIENVNASNNEYGLKLWNSNNNTATNNNANSNKKHGIYMISSSNNTLANNTVNSNAERGIWLESSCNNTITKNSVNSNSIDGVIMLGFGNNNNIIYLNNFDNNSNVSSSSSNSWHSPTELYYDYTGGSLHKSYLGNYYSNHTLTDSDGDGITDSYYYLSSSEGSDKYPLANTSDHYSLQAWWLASNDKMYQDDMSKAPFSVTIGGASSHIWIAEEAELTTKYFSGSDSWTGQVVFTSTPTNEHTFTVEIGYSTDGSDFAAAGPDATLTGDGSATAFTYTTDAASVTVPQGKYLALRITNNNSGFDYNLKTGGAWSYTSALPVATFMETNAASTGSPISFNESGDGHGVDMSFTSLTGSGDVTVHQVNDSPCDAPGVNVCGYRWDISNEESITSFSVDLTFHYTNEDATGYTESAAYFGIAKFNSSTNTWQWLGGAVDAENNTVTVSGVTSFSTFALFRRIFGDIDGDGYVDAADLQRLGDCWHATNSGEFTSGSDALFFNFNKNTDTGGNQIIDAADLQVFGDCWHNGVLPE